MATIQDFIRQATSQLGVDEETVKSATGGLLGFLQNQIGAADAQRLFSQIPGAAALVADSPSSSAVRSSGVLGNLTRMAGSALGGSTGAALGLAGTLKNFGLDFRQVPTLLSTFMGFVQQNVSNEVIGEVLEKAPELRKYSH